MADHAHKRMAALGYLTDNKSKGAPPYGNKGGDGFPAISSPSGPGSTGGLDGKAWGTGGTPQGPGSSEQRPSRGMGDNRRQNRSTPRVSKKAMTDVTKSMT